MSVIAYPRASRDWRPATAAWTVTGGLILLTFAAILSIGIFLIVPTVIATWWTAKRYGVIGAALGLPLGFAATVWLLGALGS